HSDCTQIEGRLRVGYLAKKEAGIAESGGNWTSHGNLLNPQQGNVKSCIDVFVNTGWNEGFVDLPSFGDYPLLFSFDGLFGGPLDFMSTSYAAPVILSHLIHYKQVAAMSGRDYASPKDLIDAAIIRPGMPTFIDPARFGQFELCRLYPEYCLGWESFTLKN
ncbi:MAG: hypothetical protein M3Q07_19320, partial [Pseudobdellovibrionaceae bacterium]|nr:hypothetical protein [Pseudobdellovibrionaceae bacterium]